jgi:hypothetical protein
MRGEDARNLSVNLIDVMIDHEGVMIMTVNDATEFRNVFPRNNCGHHHTLYAGVTPRLL